MKPLTLRFDRYVDGTTKIYLSGKLALELLPGANIWFGELPPDIKVKERWVKR